jgi:hypothetical protein
MGAAAEDRFESICTQYIAQGKAPSWLSRVVKATKEEDDAGTDFFVETVEEYRIRIDVKSSSLALRRFELERRNKHANRIDVIGILVSPTRDGFEVWCDMLCEVSTQRLELLAKRAATD